MDDVCSPARIRNVVGKYSNLRLSIAHLGGFQYEELYGLNAYFNLSAVLPDLVDRMGIENTNIVLRSLGVEKLVFATDYPDSRSSGRQLRSSLSFPMQRWCWVPQRLRWKLTVVLRGGTIIFIN